ncbi:MAG: division/cell wall cluster transcriptional repressor MraZ [Clostridiales bacterium]|nr:division/cell wall cluster transcriptional repressor MraZ [Clostridiales bacterium]
MTGQYTHTVDTKGRLFIPAKLREELGDTFFVTIGMDGCLSVYSDESWANFMEKLSALPYSKTKALRALLANACKCEPDGQGRILLPAKLRQYANLPKDVVVIGSFDRAEIWDAQRWTELENEALSSGDLEAAMEEMGL